MGGIQLRKRIIHNILICQKLAWVGGLNHSERLEYGVNDELGGLRMFENFNHQTSSLTRGDQPWLVFKSPANPQIAFFTHSPLSSQKKVSCLWHQTASGGKVPVMELLGVWSMSLLLLLPGPLWPRVIIPIRIPFMGRMPLKIISIE